MHSTTLTIGWVSAYPKSPAPTQERALASFGVLPADIVVDGRQVKGRSRETWAWLLKKARPGDTIAVTKLRAIYSPRGKETPRKALFRALHDLEDRGCKIVEISTGLHSSNARERDKMIAACLDELARSRSGGDAGRPKRELSAAEHALGRRHWFSHEHETNVSAVFQARKEAGELGMRELLRLRSPQAFINVFGPSGRPYRSKRKTR
jgi:hypothetical protein